MSVNQKKFYHQVKYKHGKGKVTRSAQGQGNPYFDLMEPTITYLKKNRKIQAEE